MTTSLIDELSESLSELLHYSKNRHLMGRGHEYMDGTAIEKRAEAALSKARSKR